MSKNKINNLKIITSASFPQGMAATNRVISLAKGFIANGIDTEVLCLIKFYEPRDTQDIFPSEGEFEGIKYRNIFKSNIRLKYKLSRAIAFYFKSILILIYGIKSINRNSIIIYYSHESLPALALKIVTLLKGATLIKEETEHPSVRTIKKGIIGKFFFLKFHYQLFDGLSVITENLLSYFKHELNYKKPIILTPMIVDIERFDSPRHRRSNTVVFTGELDEKKEGLSNLIKAFEKVVQKHPEFSLNIYGREINKGMEKYYEGLITSVGVEQKVHLNGYKERDEITDILVNADILTFTRPPSLQASYGFSTKMGEYLATGNPILATKIGEISKYLKDRENAYVCDPTIDSIYAKLCEIIEDYDFAIQVGKNGKKCALNYFNNITVAKATIQEFQSLFAG